MTKIERSKIHVYRNLNRKLHIKAMIRMMMVTEIQTKTEIYRDGK